MFLWQEEANVYTWRQITSCWAHLISFIVNRGYEPGIYETSLCFYSDDTLGVACYFAYLKRKLFFCYLWILDFKSSNSGFCFSYNDKTFRDYLLEWCLFLKFCDQKDWWQNKKQAKLSNTIIELFRDRNNTFFHSSSSSGDSNASSLKSRRTQDATSSSSSSYENKSNNEICLHFGRDCIGLSLTPA